MVLTKIRNRCRRYAQKIKYKFYYAPLRKLYEQNLLGLIKGRAQKIQGTVFLDATWDNPHYWLRVSMLRAGLGSIDPKTIYGILGPFSRKNQKQTLKKFGIEKTLEISDQQDDVTNLQLAQELCSSLKDADDMLAWQLPEDLPPPFLYDYIIKLQKTARVNLKDPKLVEYVHYYLNCISKAVRLMKQYQPSLFISSHALGYNFPLVWVALRFSCVVIVAYGDFGHSRFWRIKNQEGVYNWVNCPTLKEIEKLSTDKSGVLESLGEKILDNRFHGRLDVLGAVYAYGRAKIKISKEQISKLFGWDPAKKIVGVYAANWFDYPHTYGMNNFKNSYDWAQETITMAQKNNSVNWLIKAHPIDEYYGGLTFKDLVKLNDQPHIRFAEKGWNGLDILNMVDAIVTMHGTVGLEGTALGRPVLVADRGWYHNLGFVRYPQSRAQYMEYLKKPWWESMDLKANARLAKIFCALYWGRPSWQKNFLLGDDSKTSDLFKPLIVALKNDQEEIQQEISTIEDWYSSGHEHFHTYKMLKAKDYVY